MILLFIEKSHRLMLKSLQQELCIALPPLDLKDKHSVICRERVRLFVITNDSLTRSTMAPMNHVMQR